MNQAISIFVSALIIGVISMAILAAYTNTTASKMPEQREFIQVFASGAIVGSFIAWIVSSGFLHGSSFMNMISTDISSVIKDIGLKGGEDTTVNVASTNTNKPSSGVDIPAISNMVGGFFKAMGVDTNTLQELNVGMPTF
jgi:hypothetical protein